MEAVRLGGWGDLPEKGPKMAAWGPPGDLLAAGTCPLPHLTSGIGDPSMSP